MQYRAFEFFGICFYCVNVSADYGVYIFNYENFLLCDEAEIGVIRP